jgi:hypothetical protein
MLKPAYQATTSEEINKLINNGDYPYLNLVGFDPIYTGLEVRSVVDNPANKLYKIWLEEYDGKRFLLPNYIRLKDGKYYDCYLYWFRRIDNELLEK